MMLPHLLIPLPLEHMGRSIWRVSGPIVDLRGSSDPSSFHVIWFSLLVSVLFLIGSETYGKTSGTVSSTRT